MQVHLVIGFHKNIQIYMLLQSKYTQICNKDLNKILGYSQNRIHYCHHMYVEMNQNKESYTSHLRRECVIFQPFNTGCLLELYYRHNIQMGFLYIKFMHRLGLLLISIGNDKYFPFVFFPSSSKHPRYFFEWRIVECKQLFYKLNYIDINEKSIMLRAAIKLYAGLRECRGSESDDFKINTESPVIDIRAYYNYKIMFTVNKRLVIMNRCRHLYNGVLELSVIYEDTKFGGPPHEAEPSPEHFIEHSHTLNKNLNKIEVLLELEHDSLLQELNILICLPVVTNKLKLNNLIIILIFNIKAKISRLSMHSGLSGNPHHFRL
ncbi:hypothetical protein AGLY_006005 [Aphis glycines]|uniref:Uncharacterized protein n=1 Tax=Aphis glycines TaxID=307491 RepID=A0A6G0TT13_APHGL|nr:hypothetical protein AGLY_006005 [Aphis glycines]